MGLRRYLVLFVIGPYHSATVWRDMARYGGGVRHPAHLDGSLEEPVAWQGPIVMNTREELRKAYAELRAGTFIKA